MNAPRQPKDVEPFVDHRRLLDALLASTHDAVVSKTLDGTIRTWNVGAEHLFGHSREEAIDAPITLIVPPELHDEEERILQQLRRGERIEKYETVRVARDGRRIDVSLTLTPVRDEDGAVVGAVSVARDVTDRKLMEQALDHGRRTLGDILEAVPIALSVLDREGVVQVWNAAAERTFGWPREEAVGRVLPAVPAKQREELLANLRDTLAGRPLRGVETLRQRKDGSTAEVELWSAALPDGEGLPDRVVSIVHEITGRRRAEQALRASEERFRTLADNIAQLAWMADGSGWISWYNRRWFEYTGTSLEEMEGWGWKAVHHPDHLERVVEKFSRHLAAGETWEDTFPLRAADGSYGWFLSRALPIRDEEGRVVRWFGTNTDITERMAMEEALREADRRKDEFIALLAHELRNPLAPIRTGLEVLRHEHDSVTAEAVRARMERQTEHLVRLVDDLLDVSRITRGQVELRRRRVQLADVVQQALESCGPLLEKTGHAVEVELGDEPVELVADPTRLVQVLSNLVNNAARWTPSDGRIRVQGGLSEDQVVLRVIDTGAGIPSSMIGRVFDMFARAEAGSVKSEGGLGLGLTLVKSLVELHGGRVEAHSEGEGRGSEFVVHLPAEGRAGSRELDEPSRTRPAPAEAELSQRHVLVVDDNEDAVDSLVLLLEAWGHEAVPALSGREALELAGRTRPDVVLLDIGLPDLDGHEVARRLRAGEEGDAMTLVALTGWGQRADVERTRAAGFDHHVVKPASPDRLRELIEAAPRRPE